MFVYISVCVLKYYIWWVKQKKTELEQVQLSKLTGSLHCITGGVDTLFFWRAIILLQLAKCELQDSQRNYETSLKGHLKADFCLKMSKNAIMPEQGSYENGGAFL